MDADLLAKRVVRLELLVVLLLLVSLGLGYGFMRERSRAHSEVRQLRVVDEQGRPRFLIAAPLPDPQVAGTVYPRSRPVPGVMFLDTLGNEVGGIGLFDDLDGGGLCFDYHTAEAVCLTKAPTLGQVALTILDPPPEGAAVGRTGSERLQLGLVRGSSRLVLSDPEGRPRIRLLTDSTGAGASIEVLDSAGRVVSRLPER